MCTNQTSLKKLHTHALSSNNRENILKHRQIIPQEEQEQMLSLLSSRPHIAQQHSHGIQSRNQTFAADSPALILFCRSVLGCRGPAGLFPPAKVHLMGTWRKAMSSQTPPRHLFKSKKCTLFIGNKVCVSSASIKPPANWPNFLKGGKGGFTVNMTGKSRWLHWSLNKKKCKSTLLRSI